MPLDPALRDKILASVEAGFDEQIAFTRELMRFPSIRGEEHACQDFVFRELKRPIPAGRRSPTRIRRRRSWSAFIIRARRRGGR
jgi:acetylornithine deacetylase/succinyl-diaminopimelate desuccinylase-like protein